MTARLADRAMLLARVAWIGLALTALALSAAGTPVRFTQLMTVTPAAYTVLGQLRPEDARLLAEAGLPLAFYAGFFTVLEAVTVIIALAIAALIFWGRSDDWMALFVSAFLVLSTLVLPLTIALETAGVVGTWVTHTLRTLFVASLIPLLCLFPTGRFVPRWTAWPAIASLALSLAGLFVPALMIPAGFGSLTPRDAPVLIGALGGALTGVLAQVWRYRHVSTPVQRVRTRSVVFGFAVLTVLGTLGILCLVYATQAPSASLFAAARLTGPALLLAGFVSLALSIGVSILRYRLWDIDVLIRRTLIYSLLTGLLALAYFASIVLLQNLARTLAGEEQNQLVTVVSTLAIAALFVPLRTRVQAFIDRRFYRRKYDAARILALFSATVRDEVELDALIERLLGVVQATMEPASASLWLRLPGSPAPAASGGQRATPR